VKGFFITGPSFVKRSLNDILECLCIHRRWAGFLPEPKVFKYPQDYIRLRPDDETYPIFVEK